MLPERLPLFPLSLVLYPDEPTPLHIFEPRYRKMIARCMLDGSPFGMVYVDERDELADVGCTAVVKRVLTRYDDGRLDILVVGGERFRLVDVQSEGDLLTAEVEPFGAGAAEDLPPPAVRERMITLHMKLLELAGEPIRPALYQSARFASFAVAPSAGLERDEKQRLLEMLSERERVEFLVRHLRRTLRRLERARRYNQLARGDGWGGAPPEVGGGGK
jgi:ATP-dependent Lon protease